MSDCPNCDANKKAADQLMDEIVRLTKLVAALRADIAAMQSGEMTI